MDMSKTDTSGASQHQPTRLAAIPLIGKAIDQRMRRAPVVAVLPLGGVIAPDGGGAGPFRRGGLNLATLSPMIEAAFAMKRLKAVALAINSPGGSPVQSALIARRIRALSEEKKVPVIAFCEDAAASGGYWLACAADEIIADGASIVGSIGVISAGFGFVEALGKLGVERRVYTAGEAKSQLDPFAPEKAEDVARLRVIQDDLHAQFRDWVIARRGERLKSEQDLFDGRFWSGRQALDLGLVDALGDLDTVCRDRFGTDVVLRRLGRPRGFLRRLMGGTLPRLGAEAMDAAADQLQDRALWARLGL